MVWAIRGVILWVGTPGVKARVLSSPIISLSSMTTEGEGMRESKDPLNQFKESQIIAVSLSASSQTMVSSVAAMGATGG